ncbi:MAG: AraC family transcriptional regulator [Monoglobales bacterium]
MKKYFSVAESEVEKPMNEDFRLHVHNDYEIYLFLKGDTKYIVEENVYSLDPGDIIIIRKNILHRAYHNSPAPYKRIVLNVDPEFFHQSGCAEYEKEFIYKSENSSDKIDSEIVHSSGIYDAFMRLKKYSEDFSRLESAIVKAIITEILYLINNVKSYSEADKSNPQLKELIKYLNLHFTEEITLDELEKKFFISKYHICHIFPKATGLTVHQYILRKRFAYAGELIKLGKSLAEAAALAGFNNYSSFYRAYIREYGTAPGKVKKHSH